MPPRIKVVGVIRFSLLAEGFAVDLYGGMSGLRDYLFDPASLAFRFHLFERLCLPSLLAQTDPDFDVVLLTSEELPSEARARLDALVAPHPNLHVLAVPVEKQHRVIRAAYESVPMESYSHRAAFRLDNDDGLARSFVARIKQLSHGLMALHDTEEPTAIAFNRGFYLHLDPEGPNRVTDAVEREPLSTGTTLLSRVDHPHNPYRFNHRALGRHFNLYSDISFPGWIRSVHAENAQRVKKDGFENQFGRNRNATALREHFGMKLSALEAI